MSIEIEAKMRIADVEALERKLASLGGTSAGAVIEVNTFFDTPEGGLKAHDQGLRIRIERPVDGSSSQTIITHKGPRAHGKLKSRMETEVRVTDPRQAADLLAALGYVQVLSFEKRRLRWSLDGCQIAIDTLPLLGTFVEIEGDSDESVLDVRERLGLTDNPLIRASYIALLREHLAEHHLAQTYIRLESATVTD